MMFNFVLNIDEKNIYNIYELINMLIKITIREKISLVI